MLRFRKKSKQLFSFLLLTLVFFSTFSSYFLTKDTQELSAHRGFFLECFVDTGNFTFTTLTTEEVDEHLQADWGHFEDLNNWNFELFGGKNILDYSANKYTEDIQAARSKMWTKYVKEYESSDWYNPFSWGNEAADTTGLIYVFPSVHASKGGGLFDGTNVDQARCILVADILGNALNDGVRYFVVNGNYDGEATDGTRAEYLLDIGIKLSNVCRSAIADEKESKVKFNDVTFYATPITSKKQCGNAYNENVPIKTTATTDSVASYNYVKLTNSNNPDNTLIIPYKMPKGYYFSGDWNDSSATKNIAKIQPLVGNVPHAFQQVIKETDTACLSFTQLVFLAGYMYDVKGYSIGNTGTAYEPGWLEQNISEFFNSVVTTIHQWLGLYSFQELIFNMGSRASTTYKGLMNNLWFASARFFYIISQILASILLLGAVVKLLVQRIASAASPIGRVNLIDGIKNLLIASFAVAFSFPFMEMLFTMNQLLVDVFRFSSQSTLSFGSLSTSFSSGGLFGGILISIVMLVIAIYFNFTYIVRGITLSVLIGVAPLACCSIGFGDKFKGLFTNWLKELVGNVFIQLFHAIIVAMFAVTFEIGSNRLIETLVILYAFIPLTKWFRETITGGSGGLADSTGGGALGVVGGIASGISDGKNRSMRNVPSGSGDSTGSSEGSSGSSSVGKITTSKESSSGQNATTNGTGEVPKTVSATAVKSSTQASTSSVNPNLQTATFGDSGNGGQSMGEALNGIGFNKESIPDSVGGVKKVFSGMKQDFKDAKAETINNLNTTKTGAVIKSAASLGGALTTAAVQGGIALGLASTGNSAYMRTAGMSIGRRVNKTSQSFSETRGKFKDPYTFRQDREKNIDYGKAYSNGYSVNDIDNEANGVMSFSGDENTGGYNVGFDKAILENDGIVGMTNNKDGVCFAYDYEPAFQREQISDNDTEKEKKRKEQHNDFSDLVEGVDWSNTGSNEELSSQIRTYLASNSGADMSSINSFVEKNKDHFETLDICNGKMKSLDQLYNGSKDSDTLFDEDTDKSVREGLLNDFGIKNVQATGHGQYKVVYDKKVTGLEQVSYGGASKKVADVKYSELHGKSEICQKSNMNLPNIKAVNVDQLSNRYQAKTAQKTS